MIAMTATASPLNRHRLRKALGMLCTTTEIVESPSRDNIKLIVHKVNTSQELHEMFQWLLTDLLSDTMTRTIVFCKNKDDTGRLNAMFLRVLQDKYYNRVEGKSSPRIHIFHKDTTESTKAEITANMANPHGTIRVLLATNSAGMGVNFSNTTQVVHFGPPREMDTFVQQLGRAGRRGEKSCALVIYNSRQLKNVEHSLLVYLNGKQCRRAALLSAYVSTEESSSESVIAQHDCCDICHEACDCVKGKCPVPVHPVFLVESADQEEPCPCPIRCASKEERALLAQNLEVLRVSMLQNSSQQNTAILGADFLIGFTQSVVSQVVEKCDQIGSVDDLMNYCNIMSYELAYAILGAFREVFSDVECVVELDEYASD